MQEAQGIFAEGTEKKKMAKTKGKILAVDDNAGIRDALEILLPLHFSEVRIISSPKGLMSLTSGFRPDVVLLDMNFHRDMNTGNEGLYWLSELKSLFPDVEVVLFTAYADVNLAVEGMKRGAFDFVVKPWENPRLIETLSRACEKHRKAEARQEPQERMLWGEGEKMSFIRKTVEKTAPTDATILITGENGTGKDMLAKEMHRLSGRSGRPMVCADAGAIPETLFESELFGHVKGAFTDAKSDHAGLFEQADGGTLFLDEIGNIPLHLQAKLLRALQNRAVTRLGDVRPVPVDIRLICATNKDIDRMVEEGAFREDLFYRINTVRIELPPLRERRDEIMPLAETFLSRFAGKYSRKAASFSPQAAAALCAYRWNGNVRELQNRIENAVIMSEGEIITPADLQIPARKDERADASAGQGNHEASDYGSQEAGEETLEMAEEKAIRSAMKRCGGNLSLVAKSLDISRPTLYSKLKKYGI